MKQIATVALLLALAACKKDGKPSSPTSAIPSGGGASGGEVDYARKIKTTEAEAMLRRMYDGARAYYDDDHVGRDGSALPKQFPASVKMTPAAGSCCPDKCVPAASEWQDPAWMALRFSVDDPHYYSYEFVSSGTGADAKFTARAVGDLDCNGTFSTYEMRGSVGPDGEVAAPELFVDKGLE